MKVFAGTSSQEGATLIEVMGSVLIFMIGIEALLAVFLNSTNMTKRGEYAYTAYHLAKNHVERLKVMDFASLSSAVETDTVINKDGDVDPAGEYKRTTAVTGNYNGDPDLTQVTVNVTYTFRGTDSPSPMQITTVVFNGG